MVKNIYKITIFKLQIIILSITIKLFYKAEKIKFFSLDILNKNKKLYYL